MTIKVRLSPYPNKHLASHILQVLFSFLLLCCQEVYPYSRHRSLQDLRHQVIIDSLPYQAFLQVVAIY